MPAPIFPLPNPVLVIDWKFEKLRPLLLAPDSVLRELMTSQVTWGSKASPGLHLGPLPSAGSKELAGTAAAAASETEV